jgi:hypothetical protein
MKIYLKGARLSFTATLFEAKIVKGKDGNTGKPKYSVASIIEPTTKVYAGDCNPDSAKGLADKLVWNPDSKAEFSKAIIAVASEKWGTAPTEIVGPDGKKMSVPKWQAVVMLLKAQNRLPLHDGAEKALTPGFAGNMYMNASSDLRPVLRHGKTGASLTAADGAIYPGAYGDVCVDVWAQDNQHGQRVNATLLSGAFSHDGEKLAGGATASEDDYAAVPAEAQQKAAATGAGAASLF